MAQDSAANDQKPIVVNGGTSQGSGGFIARTLADKNRTLIAATLIGSIGLIAGGYLMGNGLVRMKAAERAVTVRGLAEKDVTADLATWTISYTSKASDLQSAQADMDADTKAIRAFFTDLGFATDALQSTAANVSNYTDSNGTSTYTVKQRLSLRTTDIAKAQSAVKRQFDLVKAGVELEEGSGMAYSYTKLNAIKPPMIADATRDARKSAQQFAKDSGTSVGSIKSATQGYFEVTGRDGDGGENGGWGASDTPYKKVRVVTTVEFYLG